MPLVGSGGGSEIDDFSRGFNNAIAERLRDGDLGRDTLISSGVLPGGIGGTGIGMGITGLTGNYRTEDREARSEAFRERMGERITPLGSNPVRGFSFDAVDAGRRSGEGEEEFGGPPMELRESRLVAGFGGAVGGRTAEDEARPRYQLDEVIGEDVPILHSPGQLRHQRRKSREE
jgi:uncharacterized protein YbjQ (UPF0145 family)